MAQGLRARVYDDAVGDEDDGLRVAYDDRVRSLEDDVAARQRELKILSEVASKVHGEDEVQAILDIALEEILGRLGLQHGLDLHRRREDHKLHLAASRGVSPVYLEDIERNGLGECLCPEVFWSGHRMQARNTTQCPRMPTIVDGLTEPVAHACIPLRFERGSRGVLNVANLPGQLFTDDELRFLETLGHQIGLAVERARHLAPSGRRWPPRPRWRWRTRACTRRRAPRCTSCARPRPASSTTRRWRCSAPSPPASPTR